MADGGKIPMDDLGTPEALTPYGRERIRAETAEAKLAEWQAMTFPGTDAWYLDNVLGLIRNEKHEPIVWIMNLEDGERIITEHNALAGMDPDKLAALIEACEESMAHMLELEDAWRRGAISEHDGEGGTRSNRNFALRFKLEAALAELRGEEAPRG